MNQFQPTGFKVLPTVVKNLLIINGLFFLATISFSNVFNIDLTKVFGLHYITASDFSPYQFVTYMFMHGGFTHILFNMFALWMFGNTLENVWGPKRFLTYYMVTGIGAGIVYLIWISFQITPVVNDIDLFIQTKDLAVLGNFTAEHTFRLNEFSGQIWQEFQAFQRSIKVLSADPSNTDAMQTAVSFMTNYKAFFLNQSVVVGASGAVFGILLAFGMMFPNSVIYLYFAIPIKAKYFVILYGAFELFEGVMNRPGSNIAHFAHLGGMLFGYILIVYWKKKGEFR
ncbi:MAG: rhomboid family intramembrane serine protease [Bacteroidetes bacterium]|nr:rhomboid family intramembrane serine protease [Bacteroidota bacterium]MBU1580178.1 rhomboid family intramembrane serine protease [Bacteroidota bacterium]MBU2556518.1 rhomboid family intramembrane serine protease [Bacteroidota bacterium]